MSETPEKAKVPAWFWIVAVLALLWNLLGLLGFGGTFLVMNSEQILETLPVEMQEYYATIPAWVLIVYAVAVFAGLFGSIALLMKKGAATILFIISLVAIVINDIHSYVIEQLHTMEGGGLVMPIIVLIVSVFLVWFSMMSKKKGYIS